MNLQVFKQARVLFVIDGCMHCNIYKSFIERYNQKVPVTKRIEVIDATKLHDYGIIEHPLLRVFKKYLDGTYPVLFFESRKISGANSREETEAQVRTLLEDDFNIPEDNPYLFSKECRWEKKKILGRIIVCT